MLLNPSGHHLVLLLDALTILGSKVTRRLHLLLSEPPGLWIKLLLKMPVRITSWHSVLRRCVPQPIKMYHQKYFFSEKKEMTNRVWRYKPSTRSQKKLAMTQYWKKTIMALQPTWKRRNEQSWTAACFHSKHTKLPVSIALCLCSVSAYLWDCFLQHPKPLWNKLYGKKMKALPSLLVGDMLDTC